MTDVGTRETAETVVVGGGIIGLAVGFELSRRGRRVLVLERDAIGGGATAAAGGMLAPISEAEIGEPEVVTLGQDSARRYPAFVEEVERLAGFSVAHRCAGTMWVAVDPDGAAELDHARETLRGKGLDVQTLTARDARELEPHLSGRVRSGLLVSTDHQIDSRKLAAGLRVAIEALGGTVKERRLVNAVEAEAGKVCRIDGEVGEGLPFRVDCDEVVLATGAWGGQGIRLPFDLRGIRPVKGQLVRLAGEELLARVIRTPDVYLIPQQGGELLLGATVEEMGFDSSPTAGAVLDLLRRAWEALPGIYDLRWQEVNVGLRPATDDHLPVIGATPVGGLYVALGHYRHGILLAPATAELLADEMLGSVRAPALAPFALERLDGVASSRGAEEMAD